MVVRDRLRVAEGRREASSHARVVDGAAARDRQVMQMLHLRLRGLEEMDEDGVLELSKQVGGGADGLRSGDDVVRVHLGDAEKHVSEALENALLVRLVEVSEGDGKNFLVHWISVARGGRSTSERSNIYKKDLARQDILVR